MDIKMFQMGFGESILLYEGNSCLLVDCGSESKYKYDYFYNVARELGKYTRRSLLISHFHMDHINGIEYLCDKQADLFDMVYLPNIFDDDNAELELLILQYLEDLRNKKSETYQIWQLIYDLIKARVRVRLIQRGAEFDEPFCRFKALWPICNNKRISEQWMDIQMAASAVDFPIREISFIANNLRHAFQTLTRDSDVAVKYRRAKEETDASLELFRRLRTKYVAILNAKDKEGKVIKKKLEKLFKDIKGNEHSIVFHTANDSQLQILMTGDVTTDGMEEIEQSSDIPIKDHYDIFKAPHHGTETYYYVSKFTYDELLISNGETTRAETRRGEISKRYLDTNAKYKVFCTNTIKSRCESAPVSSNEKCPDCCKNCRVGPLQIDA